MVKRLIPVREVIKVLNGLGRHLAGPGQVPVSRGHHARRRRESHQLQQGTALHQFVLPHVEHSRLQDRPSGTELVKQRRSTPKHLDQRAVISLGVNNGLGLAGPADAE
jgi:hypothetical protein